MLDHRVIPCQIQQQTFQNATERERTSSLFIIADEVETNVVEQAAGIEATHLKEGDSGHEALPAAEDKACGDLSVLDPRQADAQVLAALGRVHLSIVPEDRDHADRDPAFVMTLSGLDVLLEYQQNVCQCYTEPHSA